MREERRTIHDYTPEAFERVRQTVLHIATVLGDWMDHVTLIGGAVPSLLIPQGDLQEGVEQHPGTIDVDLGLELMVLEDEGYASIADLLRQAGYRAEDKEEDRIRRQTWRSDPALGAPVTIDFLIPRSPRQPRSVRLQNLETDFAAVIADGLHLVEHDRRKVRLSGRTLRGEEADREIWVCGPASFVVLKARAVHLREKPKDAYDLHYVLVHWAGGVPDIAKLFREFLNDRDAQEAIEFLRSNYASMDSVGPARAAFFLYGEASEATQDDIDTLRASAHAYVHRFLDEIA
jgi:hypothetical protein